MQNWLSAFTPKKVNLNQVLPFSTLPSSRTIRQIGIGWGEYLLQIAGAILRRTVEGLSWGGQFIVD